jgi:hypothetical protein
MKLKRLVIRSLLFFCVFLFHSFAFAMETTPAALSVVQIKGNAFYSTNEHEWFSLAKGDLITQGYIIQTATNSSLDLLPVTKTKSAHTVSKSTVTSGSGLIQISGSSRLFISTLSASTNGDNRLSNVRLILRSGEMMGNMGNPSKACSLEMQFENGFAVTRSATYKMNSSGWLRVQSGSLELEVTRPDNSTEAKLVTASHQYDPVTNEITPASPNRLSKPGKSSAQSQPLPASAFRIPVRPGI